MVTVVENSCLPLISPPEGCIVQFLDVNTVSGLGLVEPAAGIASCEISCPVDGGNFVVSAFENSCQPLISPPEGCSVETLALGATTVTGLGLVEPAAGYVSCEISCPVDGGNFVVSVVAET